MSGEFVCAYCKRTFTTITTESELAAEYEQLFPDLLDDQRETLCEDCFQRFMAWARAQGLVQ